MILKSACCGAAVDKNDDWVHCRKCGRPCELEGKSSPSTPCDFCGKETDDKMILRDTQIEKADGSDIVLCSDCVSNYAAGEYDKIKLKVPAEPEIGKAPTGEERAHEVAPNDVEASVPAECPVRDECKCKWHDDGFSCEECESISPAEPEKTLKDSPGKESARMGESPGMKDGTPEMAVLENPRGFSGDNRGSNRAIATAPSVPESPDRRPFTEKVYQNDEEIAAKVIKLEWPRLWQMGYDTGELIYKHEKKCEVCQSNYPDDCAERENLLQDNIDCETVFVALRKPEIKNLLKVAIAEARKAARANLSDAVWRRMDWSGILYGAIKSRPSSWSESPVREWRNASDEVQSSVIMALEKAGLLKPFLKELK